MAGRDGRHGENVQDEDDSQVDSQEDSHDSHSEDVDSSSEEGEEEKPCPLGKRKQNNDQQKQFWFPSLWFPENNNHDCADDGDYLPLGSSESDS